MRSFNTHQNPVGQKSIPLMPCDPLIVRLIKNDPGNTVEIEQILQMMMKPSWASVNDESLLHCLALFPVLLENRAVVGFLEQHRCRLNWSAVNAVGHSPLQSAIRRFNSKAAKWMMASCSVGDIEQAVLTLFDCAASLYQRQNDLSVNQLTANKKALKRMMDGLFWFTIVFNQIPVNLERVFDCIIQLYANSRVASNGANADSFVMLLHNMFAILLYCSCLTTRFSSVNVLKFKIRELKKHINPCFSLVDINTGWILCLMFHYEVKTMAHQSAHSPLMHSFLSKSNRQPISESITSETCMHLLRPLAPLLYAQLWPVVDLEGLSFYLIEMDALRASIKQPQLKQAITIYQLALLHQIALSHDAPLELLRVVRPDVLQYGIAYVLLRMVCQRPFACDLFSMLLRDRLQLSEQRLQGWSQHVHTQGLSAFFYQFKHCWLKDKVVTSHMGWRGGTVACEYLFSSPRVFFIQVLMRALRHNSGTRKALADSEFDQRLFSMPSQSSTGSRASLSYLMRV